MNWLLLILSLPTESAAVRQRTWRSLKASGAAVLRDGVYLMPALAGCREVLDGIARDIRTSGGQAHVLLTDSSGEESFIPLFDRSADYAELLQNISLQTNCLGQVVSSSHLREVRRLRKSFEGLTGIDFFPNDLRHEAEQSLLDLEARCAQLMTPHEPSSQNGNIQLHRIEAFQNKTWATRARPWVDRLASAWLIRRFIQKDARILWLDKPSDCPPDAIGFDFDGATFSHQGQLVTFEVLALSFGLKSSALKRIGEIVHYLDVGGSQPLESIGLEKTLSGLRSNFENDDELLAISSTVFDALLTGLEDAP